MAEPIPQADAALLAAQAQAGQAGVAAYQAAKAELEGQRSNALQTALREASLRGTPLEAAQSLQSQVTGGYDRQLAQLSQGQASFTADMAARGQRATDYNAAVGSARSLIPVQVQQQVAPILARNQFELGQIDRQSAARVSEIEAQRRLYEARAAAEFEAYMVRKREADEKERQRAAKEAAEKAAEEAEMPDLNQSELRAALVEGGRANLGQVYNDAAQTARRRADDSAEEKRFRNQSRNAQDVRQAEERRRQQLQQQQRVGAAAGIFGADPASVLQSPSQRQQQRRLQASPGSMPYIAAGVRSQPTRSTSDVSRAMAAEVNRLRSQQAQQRDVLQARSSQAGRPPFPTGFISPEELGGMGSYGQILGGAGEQLTPTSLTRLIGGAPDQYGQVSPIASDLFREAMLNAAANLSEQGYDLDDAQILEAIGSDDLYDAGGTLFDVESRATGGRDIRDQFERDQAQMKADEADQRRMAREDEADIAKQDRLARQTEGEQADLTDEAVRQEFFKQWGIPLTNALGPRDQVVSITSSEAFDQAVQAFEQAADGETPSSRSDVDAILDDAGVRDPTTRRLIRAIYLG